MPTKFYEPPTDDEERPKRFCDGLRHDLKYCLMNSDCVQKNGKSPKECLLIHDDSVPEECHVLRNSFFECKRSMLDMRNRFRGKKGYWSSWYWWKFNLLLLPCCLTSGRHDYDGSVITVTRDGQFIVQYCFNVLQKLRCNFCLVFIHYCLLWLNSIAQLDLACGGDLIYIYIFVDCVKTSTVSNETEVMALESWRRLKTVN